MFNAHLLGASQLSHSEGNQVCGGAQGTELLSSPCRAYRLHLISIPISSLAVTIQSPFGFKPYFPLSIILPTESDVTSLNQI